MSDYRKIQIVNSVKQILMFGIKHAHANADLFTPDYKIVFVQ